MFSFASACRGVLVKACWTEDFAAVLAEMVSLMLSFLVPFPDRHPVSRICKFHWKIAVCCDPYRLILEARAPRERHASPKESFAIIIAMPTVTGEAFPLMRSPSGVFRMFPTPLL